ncbi:LGFP repeat-containing protein [Nakamurella endophytica]|uniref:Twin-arginine translocation signal domain-containing protein n=1 Tax=Nakamurella endophytica TaxID=1748367 RepID=A0A917TCZ8_9ACTN|nr:hypothetical protein [Nakamurella endophytica]GGM18383.1 hypothetical protein GCM10011594_43110 [Nakamurella endophytica]
MSVAEIVVNTLARGWRRTADRRSFLASAAVVGSALATHPWRYASRPVSAYDSVCGDGAACADGWSVFCCSIDGANQCPPGSFVGGWWKADQSGFCCGSARYYVDCNATCGSDWKCHCGSGSCDQRRVACNQFRYGQCHQEIDCYGPVVCRVVTCTPPWQFDPSCTATSLTDNRTATHSAACLPGDCPSQITRYWYDHGGPGGSFGPQRAAERASKAGGTVAAYRDGLIYVLRNGQLHTLTGATWDRYLAAGAGAGPLGDPSSTTYRDGVASWVHTTGGLLVTSAAGAHAVIGDLLGAYTRAGGTAGIGVPVEERHVVRGVTSQRCSHGILYGSAATGAHAVAGPEYRLYASRGLAGGKLGLPVSDRAAIPGGGVQVKFQRGRIYTRTPGGASAPSTVSVEGVLFDAWARNGGSGGRIGFPLATESAWRGGSLSQPFEHGGMSWSATHGPKFVTGPLWARWQGLTANGRNSVGVPIGDVEHRTAGSTRISCERGAVIDGGGAGPVVVHGAIWDAYQRAGAERSDLGLPVSDVYVLSRAAGARQRCDFQHGRLTWDPATGAVTRG